MPSVALRGLALALALLAGCGPAAPGGDHLASSSTTEARAAVSTTELTDSLRLWLEVPREVRPGAVVPLTLRAENVAGRPLELYLRGREVAFDVVVARAAGEVAWRRLADEIIPAIVQVRVLAPGEVLELTAEWSQRDAAGRPVNAGEYIVRGYLLTEHPEPLETPPVALRIVDR